ncbi:hypothetical protein HYPDE_33943 [Hyphomicrobium denitrificans 1NES1]|uniref:Uncharacterized protein n=1 Tax=Hyphomicrobium denitrificans 1NES1 TaxID=670307 RepID=N0BD73_9HYPH|nr:hypothetical protein [Hyphomicrobium denitrificans]AGK58461.1 hypothetical protein HYPDE_33943 [Hyphomicrobium denitrificans 1NES1]
MMTSLIACCRVAVLAMLVSVTGVAAYAEPLTDEPAGSIEQLLKSGWEVAGYSSNSDNRSTFILFKNSAQPYLVQCLAGYDVTRTPRVFENCYKLR